MDPVVKTYVLLDHTDASAQVFQQINANQRVRLTKRPFDHAYGQVTFMDREGKNRTIRYKAETDEIFMDVQVKEKMIPANAKYTQTERDALLFRDGVLITDNTTVQLFLETSPQFEDFWKKDAKGRVGRCPEIRGPLYKLLDETQELQSDDDMFMKRVAAANKIAALKNVREGQELMIRLNGSFFKAPKDILKIRSELIRYLDDADEAMLDNLLRGELNVDEKATVLLGKAINAGIISFDQLKDHVVKVKGERLIKLKEISSEHLHDERLRYFMEFLTSPDGALTLQDIEKEVSDYDKKHLKAATA